MENLWEKYKDLKVALDGFLASCSPAMRGLILAILFPWIAIGTLIWGVAEILLAL